MLKPSGLEPKLSKENPWVEAQEDAQIYTCSRFETGMPGEVRLDNENVCKLLQCFSLHRNGKTIPAVSCKILLLSNTALITALMALLIILPFQQILELQLRSNQNKAPLCLGQTVPERAASWLGLQFSVIFLLKKKPWNLYLNVLFCTFLSLQGKAHYQWCCVSLLKI